MSLQRGQRSVPASMPSMPVMAPPQMVPQAMSLQPGPAGFGSFPTMQPMPCHAPVQAFSHPVPGTGFHQQPMQCHGPPVLIHPGATLVPRPFQGPPPVMPTAVQPKVQATGVPEPANPPSWKVAQMKAPPCPTVSPALRAAAPLDELRPWRRPKPSSLDGDGLPGGCQQASLHALLFLFHLFLGFHSNQVNFISKFHK